MMGKNKTDNFIFKGRNILCPCGKITKLPYKYILFCCLFQVNAVFPWEYVDNNNKAVEKYKNREYEQAENLLRNAHIENPDNFEIKYNLANSLYKQQKYIESQSLYMELLKKQDLSADLKEKIKYNLGNIFYRLGQDNNPSIFWPKSLEQYQLAIDISSKDTEAKENYQFVKKNWKCLITRFTRKVSKLNRKSKPVI